MWFSKSDDSNLFEYDITGIQLYIEKYKQKPKFRSLYQTRRFLSNLEKRKSCADKRNIFGALLLNLSKALDHIDDELLIAKLNTYVDYLSNVKQETRIDHM